MEYQNYIHNKNIILRGNYMKQDEIQTKIAKSIDEFLITFWGEKSFDNIFLNKIADYIIYKNPDIFKEVNIDDEFIDVYEENKKLKKKIYKLQKTLNQLEDYYFIVNKELKEIRGEKI